MWMGCCVYMWICGWVDGLISGRVNESMVAQAVGWLCNSLMHGCVDIFFEEVNFIKNQQT